jgi:hypothetical protein
VAATSLVLAGILIIVVPTAALMASLGDSVHDFIGSVRDNTLQVPPPREGVAAWPPVGRQVHGLWSLAHTDLPAAIQSLQPKIGDLSKMALGMVAGIGVAIPMFLFSFIVAGVIMAFGQAAMSS